MLPLTYRQALANRRFRLFTLGFGISSLGDGMSALAVAWLAIEIMERGGRHGSGTKTRTRVTGSGRERGKSTEPARPRAERAANEGGTARAQEGRTESGKRCRIQELRAFSWCLGAAPYECPSQPSATWFDEYQLCIAR